MPKTIGVEEQLKRAIQDCGEPTYAVAVGSGVSNPSLYRFLSGQRGLSFESAAKICRYLGLELVPIRPKVPKGKDGKA